MRVDEETALTRHAANKQNIDTGAQVATDWVRRKPAAIYTNLSNQNDICSVVNTQRITQDLATGKKVSLVSKPKWIRNSFHLCVTLADVLIYFVGEVV